MERDFGVRVGRLTVRLYPSHAAFAAALWRQQHTRPQSPLDDTSSIRGSTLLLGPEQPAYLAHDLVHVYAEWLMDRLSGNSSDRLPPEPWLYDGLAEVEASRYAGAGWQCAVHGPPPFDVTHLHTARAWLVRRAGPWGSLEYCLAEAAAQRAVRRLGWRHVLALIRREGWKRAGSAISSAL
jgi:hypothetical protein